MKVSRRGVLLGSASAAMAGYAFTSSAFAAVLLDPASDEASRKLIARMVRVMYPHKQFGDAPYARSAEGVLAAASKTPGQKVAFAAALADVEADDFAGLDDAAALDYLRGIEGTAFFTLVRGNAILTLYNDPEVWGVLGYEGPSFDKGGYINRGFNDLDWLPEPRVAEYEVGQ